MLSDQETALKKINVNFLNNAGPVGDDITRIYEAFVSQNYYDLGYAAGDILNILLTGKAGQDQIVSGDIQASQVNVTCMLNVTSRLQARV